MNNPEINTTKIQDEMKNCHPFNSFFIFVKCKSRFFDFFFLLSRKEKENILLILNKKIIINKETNFVEIDFLKLNLKI